MKKSTNSLIDKWGKVGNIGDYGLQVVTVTRLVLILPAICARKAIDTALGRRT